MLACEHIYFMHILYVRKCKPSKKSFSYSTLINHIFSAISFSMHDRCNASQKRSQYGVIFYSWNDRKYICIFIYDGERKSLI